MRHTQEGNIHGREMSRVSLFLFAGESSLSNVTLRDEKEVNKQKGSFSANTVTRGSEENLQAKLAAKTPIYYKFCLLMQITVSSVTNSGAPGSDTAKVIG